MGPVWDFNISFGNVDYNDSAMMPYGWIYEDNWRMYWFRRMMKDNIFSKRMNCRWHELRGSMLSTERITGIIDSLVTVPVECITGLEESSAAGDLVSIYPNPFSGILQFRTEGYNGINKIQLLDLRGKQVLDLVSEKHKISDLFWEVDSRETIVLTPGIYIALIGMQNGAVVYKKLIRR